jgi:pimeloyl-ACP methyl ester carboxylesterase
MPFLPSAIFGMWFRGLLAIAILGGSVYLFSRWARELPDPSAPRVSEVDRDGMNRQSDTLPLERASFGERVAAWKPGWDRLTAFLAGAVALALIGTLGRFITTPLLFRRSGSDEPHRERAGTTQHIVRPDGTKLEVQILGLANGPTVILTHGWGNDGDAFYYVKRQLGEHVRLVFWDLPGHGRSSRAVNNDYTTERLAADLRAVIESCGSEPVTLVGHSLGGMTVLTLCRLYPELLNTRVASLVLVHTTYTDPLRTTSMSGLYKALQKPLLEPLLHLTIWLSPVVWLMNWISYWNGSAHRSTARQSFAGTETRGQLNFAASYTVQTSPAVLARGALGMLRYDAQDALARITVPVRVIAADGDSVCLPEASQFMAATIPSARLHTLGPARHLGLMERNEDFSRLLESAVATDSPTGKRASA